MIQDGTDYSAKGGWWNCNLIRFKEGYVQKMGGWVLNPIPSFLGICRYLHSWQDLSLNKQLAICTNLKVYVGLNDSSSQDITPIRATINAANNPFTTTASSTSVSVSVTGHGAGVGDFVLFAGATGTTGGVSAATFNQQYQVTSVTSVNAFTITLAAAATGSATGGGNAVTAQFDISVGAVNATAGGGWGAGNWGRSTWGSGIPVTSNLTQLRLWSADNFGQDLVYSPRSGAIYYWVANAAGRGANISTLSGASDTPVVANYIMVSPTDQRVFAFGTNPIGSSTLDPLFIRWSTDGSAANWTPNITNSAGSLRLSTGSAILCALRAQGQILVWTESSLTALLFVGGDLTYGSQIITPNTDLIGPNAACSVGDFAMWMGRNCFYTYNGSVNTVPCPVRARIFNNLNLSQAFKICATSNKLNREITFFYPSANSLENDLYVTYNYGDNTWYFGSLARTAWADLGVETYPIGASPDGNLYYHEFGWDDGSTNPPTPLDSFIESGPIELGDGDRFVFMSKIIPDITFDGSTAANPLVIYTISPKDYPGGPYYPGDTDNELSVSIAMEEFTTKLDTRIRGRHFIIRIESGVAQGQGIAWRLGVQRFLVQPDGQR
jgi:ribosomal protein S9